MILWQETFKMNIHLVYKKKHSISNSWIANSWLKYVSVWNERWDTKIKKIFTELIFLIEFINLRHVQIMDDACSSKLAFTNN